MIRRFWADESGATAIEYALVGGIMLTVVVSIAATGGALTEVYERDKRQGRSGGSATAAPIQVSADVAFPIERIGQPDSPGSAPRRLLLALVRRPPRQPDDLEGRRARARPDR